DMPRIVRTKVRILNPVLRVGTAGDLRNETVQQPPRNNCQLHGYGCRSEIRPVTTHAARQCRGRLTAIDNLKVTDDPDLADPSWQKVQDYLACSRGEAIVIR